MDDCFHRARVVALKLSNADRSTSDPLLRWMSPSSSRTVSAAAMAPAPSQSPEMVVKALLLLKTNLFHESENSGHRAQSDKRPSRPRSDGLGVWGVAISALEL